MDALLWVMNGLLVETGHQWTRANHDLTGRAGGTFTPQTEAAIVGARVDVFGVPGRIPSCSSGPATT